MTFSLPRNLCLCAVATCWFAPLSANAQILGPMPSTAQGNDPVTKMDYAIFAIAAETPKGAGASGSTAPPATLTIQCSQARNHRKVDLFFDPAAEINTTLRTFDTASNAVPNPTAKVALDMDGAKTFKLVWERMPGGEYHYLNTGGSGNLLTPLFLMQWMYSTRITRARIAGLPGEAEFHASNLITEAYKSPLCKP